MQLFISVITRPRPGVWPKVLVTILIVVIVALAGWAAYGPSGVIAVLAGGGALTQLTPLALRQASVRSARGRQ